jgi:tetratricopeptide (TPR) repeat protein
LILGYSCSDVFDLCPQIEALAEKRKLVYLVQHADSPKTKDIRSQNQKNPFKAFDNSFSLFFNTGDLIKELWKATLEIPYPDASVDYTTLKTIPDWKVKVHGWFTDSVQTSSAAFKDLITALLFNTICEWRAAISQFEHYARGHANDWHAVFALGNMGEAYRNLGEYRKAIEFHEQALEIARRIGDAHGEGFVLGYMGAAYAKMGMKEEALKCFEASKAIFGRLGLKHMVAKVEETMQRVGL